ncbi:MAG: M28 family peptidase, partial [Akkermansiaceae bacterium]|nr:M28 family peptidase [Akkermansiaceae bacterium]
GINFAFIGNPKHYHTPLDNLENLDQRSLQHHGQNVLGMTRQLLHSGWERPAEARGDAVFTDLFARWIIAWPARWTPWMAGTLFAAMAFCVRL